MSKLKLEYFAKGERVTHLNLGEGTVVSNESGTVTVRYDNPAAGKPVIGVYDPNWFRVHPAMLANLSHLDEE